MLSDPVLVRTETETTPLCIPVPPLITVSPTITEAILEIKNLLQEMKIAFQVEYTVGNKRTPYSTAVRVRTVL